VATDSVIRRWNFISVKCNIPREEFKNALKLILDSTFFSFDNVIYKLNFGTPMGSPLSTIIADLVMCDLEERVLETLGVMVPFYVRYIDDIATAIPSSTINHTLNIFNLFHYRLQFTLEIGREKLNFLHITMYKRDNSIEFNWFHKSTFSGRCQNFMS